MRNCGEEIEMSVVCVYICLTFKKMYLRCPSINVYVILKYYKFYRLTDLQLKIDKYVEEKPLEKLKHIIVGAICLAKHPQTNK